MLEPLAELAPELRHPKTRATVREMLEAVGDQAVRRVTSTDQEFAATGSAGRPVTIFTRAMRLRSISCTMKVREP